MTGYSVQPRYIIFVKGYGILSFAKNMGKNISENLSGQYDPGILAAHRKLLDHAKQSATDPLKTSLKRVIQETVEATGDLIGNKITNKIMGVSKSSQQNNSEIVTNEHNKKYLRKDIYLQKKDKKLLMNCD